MQRLSDARSQRAFTQTVIASGKARFAGRDFRLVSSCSLDNREEAGLLVWDRRLKSRKPLHAFVGHRFTAAITPALRHNLQVLLGPYGVRLVYSDSDMPNGSVFEGILRRIRESDRSIFKVGALAALKKPYFYCNCQKKRSVIIGRCRERITTASDLHGMLHSPYVRYEDLFRDLAALVPGFLKARNLMQEELAW